MIKFFIILFGSLVVSGFACAQTDFSKQLDSLFAVQTAKPLNGIVLVDEKGITNYLKCFGFSRMEERIPLKPDDQFVIGSISKQMTAVVVLQEYDKGNLELHVPIKKYLPELIHSWADSVTVHHLLTHTHGISEGRNAVLAFTPGSRFSYSQVGYELLSQIVARTSGKSFATLSKKLFQKCKMKSSFHSSIEKYKNLATGYIEEQEGELNSVSRKESFNNAPIAAGGFISTAGDLARWNKCLHEGKLLTDSTYRKMVSKQQNAVRQHPIFGVTYYGYGITVSDENGVSQLGQTGFTLGFVSMNFYFPKTKSSVIILTNVVQDLYDIKKTFYYHVQVLKILRANQ
jgi:D-alanyl-D-alanine carboxypeptidase